MGASSGFQRGDRLSNPDWRGLQPEMIPPVHIPTCAKSACFKTGHPPWGFPIPSSNPALSWQPMGRLRSFINEQEKVTQRGDDKRFYPSLDYNSLFNLYRFKPYKLSNTGTIASPFPSWGILASVFQCLQKSLKRIESRSGIVNPILWRLLSLLTDIAKQFIKSYTLQPHKIFRLHPNFEWIAWEGTIPWIDLSSCDFSR